MITNKMTNYNSTHTHLRNETNINFMHSGHSAMLIFNLF